jgi:hypothetical protein
MYCSPVRYVTKNRSLGLKCMDDVEMDLRHIGGEQGLWTVQNGHTS